MRKFLFTAVISIALAAPAVFACDGAGSSKHIGLITSVDSKSKTFTIQDAETQSPITFAADDEILKGLEGVKGRVLVNYEEGTAGRLKAVGVTF